MQKPWPSSARDSLPPSTSAATALAQESVRDAHGILRTRYPEGVPYAELVRLDRERSVRMLQGGALFAHVPSIGETLDTADLHTKSRGSDLLYAKRN